MDELISRAALLKECAECQKTDPRFEERGWANHFLNEAGEPSTEWYCVEDMIENAPAVDAVPVVHGRWMVTDAYPHNVYCSECYKTFAQTHWAVWEDGSLPRNFCPNCGAKMDGERRDES